VVGELKVGVRRCLCVAVKTMVSIPKRYRL